MLQVVAFDDRTETLFVGDANGRNSAIVAFNDTLGKRWTSLPFAFNVCGGITALASLGLVAVSSTCGHRVFTLRASDGHCCSFFPCKVSWDRQSRPQQQGGLSDRSAHQCLCAFEAPALNLADCHNRSAHCGCYAGSRVPCELG